MQWAGDVEIEQTRVLLLVGRMYVMNVLRHSQPVAAVGVAGSGMIVVADRIAEAGD